MNKIVGKITKQVETLLGCTIAPDRRIYLATSNYEHMRKAHPDDWEKYGTELINILAYPDYVGLHPTNGSIEYVKGFLTNGEHVKVAVRLSTSGHYFARSLYVLNESRVKNFIQKGTLKKT